MLLGYITNGLQNHRLEDALRLLKDHGYQTVGLTLDVAHLDPATATSKDVDQVASLLDKLDLSVSIETGGRFVLDPAQKHEPTLMTRDVAAREGSDFELGRFHDRLLDHGHLSPALVREGMLPAAADAEDVSATIE